MKNITQKLLLTVALLGVIGHVTIQAASTEKIEINTTDKVLRALPAIPAIIGAGATMAVRTTALISRELFFSMGLQAYKVALCANSTALTVGVCATGIGFARLLYHGYKIKYASPEEKEKIRLECPPLRFSDEAAKAIKKTLALLKTTGYGLSAALVGAAGLYALSSTNADFIDLLQDAPILMKDMVLCKKIF